MAYEAEDQRARLSTLNEAAARLLAHSSSQELALSDALCTRAELDAARFWSTWACPDMCVPDPGARVTPELRVFTLKDF